MSEPRRKAENTCLRLWCFFIWPHHHYWRWLIYIKELQHTGCTAQYFSLTLSQSFHIEAYPTFLWAVHFSIFTRNYFWASRISLQPVFSPCHSYLYALAYTLQLKCDPHRSSVMPNVVSFVAYIVGRIVGLSFEMQLAHANTQSYFLSLFLRPALDGFKEEISKCSAFK